MVFPVLKHFINLFDSLLLCNEIRNYFFDREFSIIQNWSLLQNWNLLQNWTLLHYWTLLFLFLFKRLLLRYLWVVFLEVGLKFHFLLLWGRLIYILLLFQIIFENMNFLPWYWGASRFIIFIHQRKYWGWVTVVFLLCLTTKSKHTYFKVTRIVKCRFVFLAKRFIL